jgi:hypothetical protein
MEARSLGKIEVQYHAVICLGELKKTVKRTLSRYRWSGRDSNHVLLGYNFSRFIPQFN